MTPTIGAIAERISIFGGKGGMNGVVAKGGISGAMVEGINDMVEEGGMIGVVVEGKMNNAVAEGEGWMDGKHGGKYSPNRRERVSP